MAEVIFWILLSINIGCVLVKKSPWFIVPINLIYNFTIVYGTTTNADYWVYKANYETGYLRSSVEIGYNLCMDLCNKVGCDFNQFLLVMSVVFMTILLITFSKYSSNYALFFSVYLIYHLFIDLIQIRYFYAGVLLSVAVLMLFKGKKWIGGILLLASCTFHASMFFFLPLLFLDFEKGLSVKVVKRSAEVVFAICILSFLVGNRFETIINMGLSIVDHMGASASEKSTYFETTTHFGWILYFALHFAIMFTTYYWRSKLRMIRNSNNCSLEEHERVDNCIKLCTNILTLQFYCIYSFPLIMINIHFYRFYRCTFYLSALCWAACADRMKRSSAYYKSIAVTFISVLLYRIPLVQGIDRIDEILDNNKFLPKD